MFSSRLAVCASSLAPKPQNFTFIAQLAPTQMARSSSCARQIQGTRVVLSKLWSLRCALSTRALLVQTLTVRDFALLHLRSWLDGKHVV